MKIVLFSTQALPTPPPRYGGLEIVCYNLGRELIKRGHEVYLVGLKGSYLEGAAGVFEGDGDELRTFEMYKEELLKLGKDGGVIHCHSWLYAPILLKEIDSKIPVLHTHHGPVFNWGSPPPYPKPCLVGLSRFHSVMLSAEIDRKVIFVYNGIDLEKYPLNTEKRSNRILFLNRIDPAKGAHIAIHLAKENGWELDIVGGTRLVPSQGYVEEIMRRCAEVPNIRFWGEVDSETKIRLLQNAKCLINVAPDYSEPFGLFFVEAMATGCPVVSLNRGSAGEIIIHERTGFLTNSFEDLIKYIDRVGEINPLECRKRAEYFSKERMCENYLFLYEKVIKGEEW